MEALRGNDVEAYMRLVAAAGPKNKNSSRIEYLLSQARGG